MPPRLVGVLPERVIHREGVLELGFVEVVVQPAIGEQAAVGADLDDAPVLHRHDLVGVDDGPDT